METRIESLGDLELIGVTLYGNPGIVEFSSAWEHFGQVADEAKISRIGRDLFGLQIYPPWFPRRFETTYMACIERNGIRDVPLRMVTKTIPQSRYVVGKVAGGVPDIDQVMRFLYQEYIPKNGYRVAMPIDFERYRNVQSHDVEPSDIEVWIPVIEE